MTKLDSNDHQASNHNSEHCDENHHTKHHHHHKSCLVTVTYVGKNDWVEEVVSNTPLHLLKMNAMRSFELELAQHERYVLQFKNADQKDSTEIGCFGVKEITLALTLKEEPNKG